MPKKAKKTPFKSTKNTQWGLYLLWSLLVALVAIFWFSGGATRIANSFAQRKVAAFDDAGAEYWIGWSNQLSLNNAEVLLLKARLARRAGDFSEMARLLNLAEKQGASSKQLHQEKVLAEVQVGNLLSQHEPEIHAWLLDQDLDHQDVCSAYANGLAAVGRTTEAQSILEAWAADFPSNPAPVFRKARIAEYTLDPLGAEKLYEECLQRDPEYFPAVFNLGRLLSNRSRTLDAIPLFEKCLQAKQPAAVWIGLASCYKASGRFEDARRLLEQATSCPRDQLVDSYRFFNDTFEESKAYAEFGKLEADLGNLQRAESLLVQALEVNPVDTATRFAYATVLRQLKKTEQANREFETVRVANEALATGTELMRRAMEDPQDVEARFGLGKLHLLYDSATKGLYWLKATLTLDPKHRETHQLLAEYFESQQSKNPDYADLARKHRRILDTLPTKESASAEPK